LVRARRLEGMLPTPRIMGRAMVDSLFIDVWGLFSGAVGVGSCWGSTVVAPVHHCRIGTEVSDTF
jgi:hypothetical protein